MTIAYTPGDNLNTKAEALANPVSGGGLTKRLHATCIVLGMVALWFSRFSSSAEFGLYEDDVARVGKTWDWTSAELLSYINYNLSLTGQGRPLHEILIGGLAWLVAQIADLSVLYVLGFSIICLNLCLFSLLLKRIYPDPLFIGIGTLAFALYPSDTTQALLTHNLGLQPSLTMLLIGMHAYLSGWYPLAYPLAVIGCMLTYEPVFPIFLAAPLLLKEASKRHWIRHLVVCLGMTGLIMAKRFQLHSSRIGDVDGHPVLASLKSLLIGPIVNLATLFWRPISVLFDSSLIQLIAILGWTLLFMGLIWSLRSRSMTLPTSDYNSRLLRFAFTALFLAYPIMLNVPPYSTFGRRSRIHFAAMMGAVLLQAFFLSRISRSTEKKKGVVLSGLLSFYLALLLGFGWQVQSDYVRQQELQRQFFSTLFTLAPDLEGGDLIVVERPETRTPAHSAFGPGQILGLSWSTTMAAEFMIPRKKGEKPPLVAIVRDLETDFTIFWDEELVKVENPIFTYRFKKGPQRRPERVIILTRDASGDWQRLESLHRDGKKLVLKPNPPAGTRPNINEGLLKKLLIENNHHSAASRR